MKALLNKKAAGFYVVVIAVCAAIVSLVRFLMWAPLHKGMDRMIVVSLLVGIAAQVIMMLRDNDYLVILITVCYSAAFMKLLTNSVGSFVDAFQGINMFGDATQVSTILSISIVMLMSILLSILTGFLKRIKE